MIYAAARAARRIPTSGICPARLHGFATPMVIAFAALLSGQFNPRPSTLLDASDFERINRLAQSQPVSATQTPS